MIPKLPRLVLGPGLVFLGAMLAGCGGQEPGPATAPSAAGPTAPVGPKRSAGSTPAGAAAPGPSQTPPGAVSYVAPQLPRLRDDFQDVAKTVSPATPMDPWPTEHLALSAEAVLEGFVLRLVAGEFESLRGSVTRNFQGSVPGPLGANPSGRVELQGQALLEALAQALAPDALRGAKDLALEVSVTEVTAPDLDASPTGEGAAKAPVGHTVAHVRLGLTPEALTASGGIEPVEIAGVLEIDWVLGRRARMAQVLLRDVVKSDVKKAPFRDVTSTVLGGSERILEGLGRGALEITGRVDKVVPYNDCYLAMHGLAAGDLDGDGFDDLVVARAGGEPNWLFMNREGRLVEEGATRGLDFLNDTGGVLIADLDGDGARDVALAFGGDICIAWNDGLGRFDARTVLDAPENESRVYSISAADVDLDGDLDLYDTRYFRSGGYGAQAPTPYHDAMNGAPNVFWRNLSAGADGTSGRRTFRDDTVTLGLDVDNDRFSLASVFDDFDGDGDLDLYVTNDFGQNNLYAWTGDGFEVASNRSGLMDKAASMGVSVGDMDLDGSLDLVVSNMHSAAGMRVTREAGFGTRLPAETRTEFMRHARGNSVFQGDGRGGFKDVTERTGAAPGGWAWGATLVDWDRDGLLDIIVPNGFLSGRQGPDLQSFFWRRVVGTTPLSLDAPGDVMDRYLGGWAAISHLSQFGRQHWNAHERTFAYHNRGSFSFADVTLSSGVGFADDGRAMVTADLDQDGRLDLIFRNRTSPILRVLQGVHGGGHRVSFLLSDGGPNGDAIGAHVTIRAGGVSRRARVTAGAAFLGDSARTQHFGLGELDTVDSVEVRWPGGDTETFSVGEPLVGATWRLTRGAGKPVLIQRARTSFPALDAALRAPLPSATPGPSVSRVPLLDPFPLGAWRLADLDGTAQKVAELAGEGGLCVLLWGVEDPAGVAALGRLSSSLGEFEASGCVPFPMAMDGVRAEADIRAALEAAGLRGQAKGGRIDRAGRSIVDLIFARTLAPFASAPGPLGLLFDAEGDLVCLYVGEFAPARVLRDVQALRSQEGTPSTLSLTGGQWIDEPPVRSLGDLPQKLRSRGMGELGDHLEERLETRPK